MDLKQRFAILNKYKKVVRELCDNELTIDSGIYIFYRTLNFNISYTHS